jgi:general secretion pathway protein D
VLFDSAIADKKISVDLQDVTFLEALDILNIQTNTFYKIINTYTIIIAPENRQKRQEYDDQVIKTFYLSNADAKGVFALLRGLIDARNVAQNDELNAITIKDTPDKIAVAERIIRANDKAKGEVVIDVELMEVKRMRRRDIGVGLPSALTETFDIVDGGVLSEGSNIRLNELELLKKQYNWIVGIPSLTYNFFKSVTEAHTIARPQLRVTEGEKASINIGDQVPIPTTTYNVSSVVGSGTPITNFTYQNIGVQISVEPRVHHNQEITLKVQIEVSSITGEVQATVGAQPIIGTRSIDTVIRLKDGQTSVLAGLIRNDERDSLSGIPGLGDTPILRRLFGSTSRSKEETDIVLSLTPHIVRMPNITAQDLEALWIGSGNRIRLMEKPSPSVLLGKGEGGTPSPPKRPEPAREAEEMIEQKAPPDEAPKAPPAPKEPPRPPKPAVLRIVPQNHVMGKGEEVQIEVTIQNGVDVAHAPLSLGYNAEILHVLDVVELGYLRQDNTPITFVRNIDNDKGSTVIGYSRQASEGASGGGMLVRVTLKGVGVGASPIFLTKSELRNSQNQKIPISLVHGRIQVREEE